MPTIIPTVPYIDGTKLDSDGHNRNVYDGAPGRGIMSTANGGLGTDNLATGFKIHSEHVLPQSLVRTSQEFSLEPIDCFEQAFSANVNPDTYSYNTAPGRLWNPVPGCAMRFYLPNPATCMMRLGFFCHPFKIAYRADPAEGDTVDRVFDCAIAFKIDGVLVDASRRPLPNTASYKTASTSASEGDITDVAATHYSERRTAAWYDMHILRNLAAGVHDVQLVMYMESVDISRNTAGGDSGTKGQVKLSRSRFAFDTAKARSASQYGLFEKRNAHLIFQRATFGVRHARVLALV